MYTQRDSHREGRGVYIPPNYRGNALCFEYMDTDAQSRDSDTECREKGENTPEAEDTAAVCREQHPSALSGLLGRLLSSDALPILAVAALLLLGGRDKRSDNDECRTSGCEDNTLMLVLLLLLL